MARTPLFSLCEKIFKRSLHTEINTRPLLEQVNFSRQLTRRNFLKMLGIGAIGLSQTYCSRHHLFNNSILDHTKPAKIAIIGAGLAGLTCAYELKKHGIDAQIFEASSRAGGRVFSLRNHFPSQQVCELGGELIDSSHHEMQRLCQELKLSLDDLKGAESSQLAQELFFIDGKVFKEAEIEKCFRPLARIILRTLENLQKNPKRETNLDRISLAEWLEKIPKLDPRFKKLLLVAYTGEYGLEPEAQSALNLLYMIDAENISPFHIFGDSDERYHIRGGNDSLTSALMRHGPAEIFYKHKLIQISQEQGRYELVFEHNQGSRVLRFDKVVLAIPFTILRQVELKLELPAEKRKVIAELGYGTNSKLMAGFSSRIWQKRYASSGSVLSNNGLQTIWDTSRGQAGEEGILTNFVGGKGGLDLTLGSAEARLKQNLPLLDQVFPEISKDYISGSAVRMSWPTAPLALGSYACYKPGQWSFSGIEGKTVDQLYFCGEHCSVDFQGFMEGAAETGTRVASEILGLSTPVFQK